MGKVRKRKKPKRNVRCTMCTKYRWLGNNKGRRKLRDLPHKDDTPV